MERFWRRDLGRLQLRRRQVRRQQREYGTGDLFGIYAWIAMDTILNAIEERTSAFKRMAPCRVTPCVIEPAQQRRQVSAKIDRALSGETITQSM